MPLSEAVRGELLTQALRAAQGKLPPATARSRTREEARHRAGATGRFLLRAYAVLMALSLAAAAFTDGLETLQIGVPIAAFFGFAAWFGLRLIPDHNAKYVDPQLILEVTEAGVTLHGKDQVHEIGWDALDAEPIANREIRSPVFAGLSLETPLGRLRLDEERFDGGYLAAALIVAGRAELRDPRRRG